MRDRYDYYTLKETSRIIKVNYEGPYAASLVGLIDTTSVDSFLDSHVDNSANDLKELYVLLYSPHIKKLVAEPCLL